ncbi:MAG TPA: Ig-like domain-containing protein, partial [Acidimicrobiales bacterium]|nr:Ig-like domain-containing protein [Acidimicrobiales bacterium]
GGSVTYTNAYFTAASISVTFSNGTDSGSGINAATTQLQRASAALSNGSCGAFGSFTNIGSAAPTSPYADSSVLSGNCYQYQYLVSDNVGNVKTYTSASVAKVDTTGPTLTVTYTGPNVYATGMTAYFKNGGSGSFTVTAADPESGISSSTFPAAPAGWSVSGSGNARTYTLGAASASSSITVSTTNGAGTGSGNQTVTITLDNTPPSVTAGAMGPTDNTTTPQFIRQGGQYYVYVTATDAGSGIASTVTDVSQVSTGQTAVPGVLGSYPAFGTTYNYRTAAITASNPVAAGAKTFSGTLTDNVGNSVMPGTLPVTVDNTNPTGSITAPSNGWATASTTVTSNSADATAGVFTAQFQYSVHNANSWTTIATDTSSPWQASWNTTGLTDGGSYDLRVITEDNASNTFTSPTVTVTVDRTAPAAPSTPLLSAGSDTGVQGDNTTTVTTPTFTGTAEAGSTVTLYDGGNQVGSGTAAGGNYSITSSALVLGAHSISATATDAAGNVSASSGVRTVTIVAPLTVTSIATSNVSGGTAGHAELGDTFSVTFNNALDPTTVDTAHVQTITLSGAGGSTTITMTGLSAASGFTVPSTYEKSGNSSAANGSLSLSNGNKTVTFTISGAFSNSGNVKTGTAGTFNFPPLATIADTYGDASAATYSQGSALLLF